MKANDKAGRGLLRLLILLALLNAGISDVSRATETASLPRSVAGTWNNPDRDMSMTFAEGGEFGELMLDPKPDLTPLDTPKPYALDKITRTRPPARRSATANTRSSAASSTTNSGIPPGVRSCTWP